jgi:DNA polymerase V
MDKSVQLPFFSATVPAGFASAADDHVEKSLDLHELLITHPAATFFVRVKGNSMEGAAIHCGDILVVDRSLEPVSGRIVVAILNGEFTVKRLLIEGETVRLVPENPAYPIIKVPAESDFQVWGTVTYIIKSCIT